MSKIIIDEKKLREIIFNYLVRSADKFEIKRSCDNFDIIAEDIIKEASQVEQDLTDSDKNKIAIEMMKKEPLSNIAHVALLKMSEMGISMESKNVEQKTEATFFGKRYSCKMIVEYSELPKEAQS